MLPNSKPDETQTGEPCHGELKPEHYCTECGAINSDPAVD